MVRQAGLVESAVRVATVETAEMAAALETAATAATADISVPPSHAQAELAEMAAM
ncbi:hypothetical protein [Pelagibacterium sp. H642]|uniref:hypothetical protein n=1 Tax=Pelagibacterium sp. H642 TaxID=1881069 RepID=UPI0028158BC2|nr:hypothetical protein [Pelagibacterium sp. H642]WMT90444.1 hypothetical protein NO934_16930 [Pelagibacterium sp. H642]